MIIEMVNIKSVDTEKFIEAVDMLINGATQTEAAKHCGLSVPTFAKRVNQYFAPEQFGNLPEEFLK